jgi:hypothetical protein
MDARGNPFLLGPPILGCSRISGNLLPGNRATPLYIYNTPLYICIYNTPLYIYLNVYIYNTPLHPTPTCPKELEPPNAPLLAFLLSYYLMQTAPSRKLWCARCPRLQPRVCFRRCAGAPL